MKSLKGCRGKGIYLALNAVHLQHFPGRHGHIQPVTVRCPKAATPAALQTVPLSLRASAPYVQVPCTLEQLMEAAIEYADILC